MERWIKINDRYMVSDHGNIKSNRCVLSPKTKKNGYMEVALYLEPNKGKMFYVHRLVAKFFIGDLGYGFEVNHKDGNKDNNHIYNLEIVTPSENRKHAYHTLNKRIAHYQGSKHPCAKIKETDVSQIRSLYSDGVMPKELSEKFKIPKSTVCKIVYRSTWKHI